MRRLLLITLASLAGLGGVAFAAHVIHVAAGPARFSVTVTPASQSVARGGVARFSVGLVRSGSPGGSTSLRVSRLPPDIRAHWQLADGTRTSVVPASQTAAILTLLPLVRTPLGTRRVKVLATSGGATRIRWLSLTVERPSKRRFTLLVTPASQSVARGATARYKLRVANAAGARRIVTLGVQGTPPGAIATVAPTALTVATGSGEPLGSHLLVVKAGNWVGGKTVRRYTVVTLTVAEAGKFVIAGDLTTPLYPGGGSPLNLRLTNPQSFDIRVSDLSVSIASDTTDPRCRGDVNYAVTQYRGAYPLVLSPGGTQLSELVPNSALWPRVSMQDLPTNQDACKGAVVSLGYSGLATR